MRKKTVIIWDFNLVLVAVIISIFHYLWETQAFSFNVGNYDSDTRSES